MTHKIVEDLRPLAMPIDECHLDPANARTGHDVDQIAGSLHAYGQRKPIVINRLAGGRIEAGNGTWQAAKALGWTEIAAVVVEDDPMTAVGFAVADNRTAELSRWDGETLKALLDGLDPDLELPTGFKEGELDALLAELGAGLGGDGGGGGDGNGDAVPQVDRAAELQGKWGTAVGQLWQIGGHRLLIGDCTVGENVARLMGGERVNLIHADPPYGMGKEKEGIANDNLYGDKLDAFQMAWWRAARPYVEDNGSAYIWGNAEDLWRLWYKGGLADSERLTFRNEMAWDKGGGGFGIGTQAQRCYFPQERCLFFMLGEQGFNNNADNYWEGWEPIRAYLDGERIKMGWTIKQASLASGTSDMGKHYFTISQWEMPSKERYELLQQAAEGVAFRKEFDELRKEFDELRKEFYSTRAYFDNTHDNMTDVWDFGRVTGEDRHGHATPKPVEMVKRAIKSSCPEGGLVYVPFGGTAPEFVAGENTGRRCYGMEISPAYGAVILERMGEAFPALEIVQL